MHVYIMQSIKFIMITIYKPGTKILRIPNDIMVSIMGSHMQDLSSKTHTAMYVNIWFHSPTQ